MASWNDISIKAKIITIAALTITTIGISSLQTLSQLKNESHEIERIDSSADKVLDRIIPLTGLVADMKFDVVQIQQFLSDVSATRGQDGLADGFENAAKFATDFRTDLAAARKLAAELGLTELSAYLEKAAQTFEPYYQTGQKMANAYVEGGPKTGNALMPEFDASSERLQEHMIKVTELAKTVSKREFGALGDAITGIRTSSDHIVVVQWIATVVTVGAALVLTGFLILGVIRPLSRMTGAMKRLATGDLSADDAQDSGRGDEIGDMARALDVFRESAREVERLKAEQEAQRRRTEEEKRRDMHRLADSFDASVKGVVQAVSAAAAQLKSNAQTLSATAQQTSQQAVGAASAAEQASGNVGTVAAATEELSCTVQEIARQVGESSRIAGVAVDEASRTNATISGLSDAAQKIGEVVGLINDIASQTNLLALNATIEAARAGEAGKGFAVVASEVKNLANQTAKATEDIQAQVGQMQSVTGSAVDAIQGIAGTIRRMSDITATIAAAVDEQGAATLEITRNVQQASTGTREVSANMDGLSQAANDTGDMARSVLAAASDLTVQAGNLRTEVDGFVGRIRAA